MVDYKETRYIWFVLEPRLALKNTDTLLAIFPMYDIFKVIHGVKLCNAGKQPKDIYLRPCELCKRWIHNSSI